jgi:hypothetical protein
VPVTFPVRRYAQPPGPEGSRVRRTPREHGVGGKCDIGYVFTNFAGGAMTKASFAGVLAPRGARCVPRAWGGAPDARGAAHRGQLRLRRAGLLRSRPGPPRRRPRPPAPRPRAHADARRRAAHRREHGLHVTGGRALGRASPHSECCAAPPRPPAAGSPRRARDRRRGGQVVLRRFAQFFVAGFARLMHGSLRYDPEPSGQARQRKPPRAETPLAALGPLSIDALAASPR